MLGRLGRPMWRPSGATRSRWAVREAVRAVSEAAREAVRGVRAVGETDVAAIRGHTLKVGKMGEGGGAGRV